MSADHIPGAVRSVEHLRRLCAPGAVLYAVVVHDLTLLEYSAVELVETGDYPYLRHAGAAGVISLSLLGFETSATCYIRLFALRSKAEAYLATLRAVKNPRPDKLKTKHKLISFDIESRGLTPDYTGLENRVRTWATEDFVTDARISMVPNTVTGRVVWYKNK